MKTKHTFILFSLLFAMLIAACTPSTAAKSTPSIAQANPPAAAPATATPVPMAAPTDVPHLGPDPKLMAAQDATANAVSARATAAAPHMPVNTKIIAGLWAGTMDFSDDPAHTEDIEVQINPDCAIDSACGFVNNLTVQCKWELTYRGTQGDAYLLEHTQTLSGDCPARGIGQYTLLASGKLMRQHVTPDFTASGVLSLK